jgi:hypothetical protein
MENLSLIAVFLVFVFALAHALAVATLRSRLSSSSEVYGRLFSAPSAIAPGIPAEFKPHGLQLRFLWPWGDGRILVLSPSERALLLVAQWSAVASIVTIGLWLAIAAVVSSR